MMASPDSSAVASRLAVRAAGLTQVELAELVGVSRSAVAQWETGRAGQMTINLARVAEALGVGVQDLVGDDKQLVPVPGDELTVLSLYRTLYTRGSPVLR